MPNPIADVLTELNALLRLTAVESATARARIGQAANDATRKELGENARKSEERFSAIRTQISKLGGVPDVVGATVARAGVAARLPLEQTVSLTEALLADLSLEHQLADRAKLTKVLAVAADAKDVARLTERLGDAHTKTIEWLTTVLGETALGGPAALKATPAQAAATGARRTATYAGGLTVKGVNKVAASAAQLSRSVEEGTKTGVSSRISWAKELGGSALKVLTAGRDAALSQAEREAGKNSTPGSAQDVRDVRASIGSLSGSELPVKNYDNLKPADAVVAVRDLSDPEDVRTVLAYERAHRNRTQIVTAAEKRIAEIANSIMSS